MKISRSHIFAMVLLLLICQGCAVFEYDRVVYPPQIGIPTPTTPPPTTSATPSQRLLKPYRVGDQWYFPMSQAHGYKEVGIASWYGDPFHGKRTSSGETYDMHTISAAHKLLPLGTYVRVRNISNNRILDMRINDRGPFVGGRIIDLSYAAANQLGVVSPGTAKVEVIALGMASDNTSNYEPTDYFNGHFTVQVGAFSDVKNAQNLSQNLRQTYGHAQVVPCRRDNQTFYRVLVGRYTSIEQVQQYELALKERGFNGAFAIAE
ncbi:MAG: septal ring lytic transglycosylase RlpA family protein [Desulfobacteraceae bacterium]|nr:septal ring lytic transglycosylase RlpA family protein [Desulfobacteraceae bacterium]